MAATPTPSTEVPDTPSRLQSPIDARTSWSAHGFRGDPSDLVQEQTLIAAWEAQVRADPDQPVFCEAGQPWVSAAQLHRRVAAAADFFEDSELEVGDRVVMSCTPSVSLIVAHLGALTAGLVVVPVNTAFTNSELANITQRGATGPGGSR